MLKNEDGAVLVLSIIIILVLTVLATALVSSINNNISFTKRHENEIKVFYAAEAGIEQAINDIRSKNNDPKMDEFKSVELDNYEFEYQITDSDEADYKIISKAKINGITKNITVAVNENVSGGIPNNALTSNNTINLESHHGTINGDIFSSGSLNITTKNGANDIFNGNIYSKGAININSLGPNKKNKKTTQLITGNIYSGGPTKIYSEGSIHKGDGSTQEIRGDILSGGQIETTALFGGQQIINGNLERFSSNIKFPIDNIDNPFEFYFPGGEGWKNENWPSYNSINNISLNDDIHRINGDQSPNNIQIDGSEIVIIDGSLEVKNNFTINKGKDDFVVFLINGAVELNKHIEGNFFIYSSDKININYQTASGKFDMNGSLMAENDITINSDHTSNSNSPNTFNLNFNPGFTKVFDDLGYSFPISSNNNSNNSSGTKKIEIVSWIEE